jgi:hypothetical protein
MATFQEILATLPGCDDVDAIELTSPNGAAIARLENRPGTAGSVRVYHALFERFGSIHAIAARQGLELYAEHTADARAYPGKHPNIDRLIAIGEQGAAELKVQVIKKTA